VSLSAVDLKTRADFTLGMFIGPGGQPYPARAGPTSSNWACDGTEFVPDECVRRFVTSPLSCERLLQALVGALPETSSCGKHPVRLHLVGEQR